MAEALNIETVLIFIFVFIVTLFLGNLVYNVVKRLLLGKVSERTRRIIARLLEYLVYLAGFYIGIYDVLGLNLTALGASLGIISLAIAFSSQQIIQNIIGGVLIALQRPITVEDWVEIGNLGLARVRDITLIRTVLRDVNGRLIYIPNSNVLSSNIINYTRSGFTQISVALSVKSSTFDLVKISRLVNKAAGENDKILPDVPKKENSEVRSLFKLPHIKWLFETPYDKSMFLPRIMVSEITKDKVTLTIKLWVREIHRKDETTSEFLQTLKGKLDLV